MSETGRLPPKVTVVTYTCEICKSVVEERHAAYQFTLDRKVCACVDQLPTMLVTWTRLKGQGSA